MDSELLEGIMHKGLRAVLAQVEVRRLLAACDCPVTIRTAGWPKFLACACTTENRTSKGRA